MDEEIKTFIKVWVSATISISYCYYFSSKIKTGLLRLLSVLPVSALFLVFPLFFTSTHLNFIILYIFSWLANFKLILFAFDKGPLFPLPPNLFRFIFFTSFPINPQQNPKSHQISKNPKSHQISKNPKSHQTSKNPKSQDHISKWIFATKVVIFSLVFHLYDYRQNLPPVLLLCLYSLYLYLALDIPLTFIKLLFTNSLGYNLDPLFNEPYLATSLQDFWSRRWNLAVSVLLRPAVYLPVRRICQGLMNSDLAKSIGVFATFFVSGLLHEVLFFYLTREKPTGEVTCFFVLHGVCTVAEIAVKRTVFIRRWKVKPVVSRVVTNAFVIVTGDFLFFPQLKRNGVMENMANEIDFFKRKLFIYLGQFST